MQKFTRTIRVRAAAARNTSSAAEGLQNSTKWKETGG
jgi:hypothetical protein